MRLRSPRSRASVLLLAAFALVFAAACLGGDDDTGGSADLADRWIRVGEDARADVETYDRALPPRLAQLLNPGMLEDDDPADLISVPVHPDGELVGSFHIRRPDGVNLVWLIYDVARPDFEIAGELDEQLDATPWQVVGGQANDSIGVIRFQSTVSSDIDGTAIVQPLPAQETFEVVVSREGSEMTLEFEQYAPVPLFSAELDERSEGVVVVRVDPGAARDAGLRPTDRLVSVAGTPVATLDDVAAVSQALVAGTESASTLTYILEIRPPFIASEITYALPKGRTLPSSFPAPFIEVPGTTVIDYQWQQQAAGSIFQVAFVSEESNAEVSDALRTAIDDAGWSVVMDQAFGFATVLQFEDESGDTRVQATVDAFPLDERLTSMFVELQSSPSDSN